VIEVRNIRGATFAAFILLVGLVGAAPSIAQPSGSRPGYIYDDADILSPDYETRLGQYARQLDDATTAEIVVYTIPSFVGHGISKDGAEIQERDMLANFIFNEVALDGITGIGKKGKNNGLLILYSLERDSGGGSMRIEVGRGLEGNITDGTAGEILDSFLVPARQEYESSGNKSVFNEAFLNTAISLGAKTGYISEDFQAPPLTSGEAPDDLDNIDAILDYAMPGVFIAFIAIMIVLSYIGRKRGRRGGGGGGGGGSSGGGGAGR
jgi:uncharacterized protein